MIASSPADRVLAAFTANPALIYLPLSDCAAAIGMSPAALVKVYRHCPELADLIAELPDLPTRKCRYCHIDMEIANTHYGVLWNCPKCFTQRGTSEQAQKPPEGYKRCPKCQKVLEATSDYFGCSGRPKSGLASHCRDCQGQASHEKYTRMSDEQREEILARNRIRYYERKKEKQS